MINSGPQEPKRNCHIAQAHSWTLACTTIGNTSYNRQQLGILGNHTSSSLLCWIFSMWIILCTQWYPGRTEQNEQFSFLRALWPFRSPMTFVCWRIAALLVIAVWLVNRNRDARCGLLVVVCGCSDIIVFFAVTKGVVFLLKVAPRFVALHLDALAHF